MRYAEVLFALVLISLNEHKKEKTHQQKHNRPHANTVIMSVTNPYVIKQLGSVLVVMWLCV